MIASSSRQRPVALSKKPVAARLKPGPVVASLTILAIVATLGGCGRYGRPKRPPLDPQVRVEATATALPSSFLAGV